MYFYAWINYSRKLTNNKSVGKIDNRELCDCDACCIMKKTELLNLRSVMLLLEYIKRKLKRRIKLFCLEFVDEELHSGVTFLCSVISLRFSPSCSFFFISSSLVISLISSMLLSSIQNFLFLFFLIFFPNPVDFDPWLLNLFFPSYQLILRKL